MREHPRIDACLASASSGERVIICAVVRGAIRSGLERLPQGRRRQALAAKATTLCAILPCEPVPEAADDHDATGKLTRQRKGLALDENDLWVAATAPALGAVLISRDSDFQQIDGLTVEDWTV